MNSKGSLSNVTFIGETTVTRLTQQLTS